MSTKSRYAIVWRVAIIMLIAVFSITGIIACGGGAYITGSSGSFSTSGGDEVNTGNGSGQTNNVK